MNTILLDSNYIVDTDFMSGRERAGVAKQQRGSAKNFRNKIARKAARKGKEK